MCSVFPAFISCVDWSHFARSLPATSFRSAWPRINARMRPCATEGAKQTCIPSAAGSAGLGDTRAERPISRSVQVAELSEPYHHVKLPALGLCLVTGSPGLDARQGSSRAGLQEGRLQRRLAKLRLEMDVMAGDGNCMFRAISHELWGTPRFHPNIRRKAVRWMKCVRPQCTKTVLLVPC